ncbi:MAG: bifunctional UDP-N-acetylglucosamine diphosphorylase/glucosamine-1-phosphate N-acetyltransferase GlmU [Gammaproteobacteria bacterium]|nr:bifunctional UDP-N-acetylglucosamine diphosphorylase/glucosamine-1-phosphate N-acetyltransferase GlmU [Gammaproteobacteria bacterium]
MKLGVVILAAGQGTRMKSSLPKVLHPLAGKPMLEHVIDCARELEAQQIVVVYGHGGERVRETLSDADLIWAEQAEQLGTGHAVEQAMPFLQAVDKVLVLYGDVPLIQADTLKTLIASESNLSLLTVKLNDASGYGRIVRDAYDQIISIVEQKDATPEQLKINEINTGIMCIEHAALSAWISKIENNNAQQEFYLTDIVAFAVADNVNVLAVHPESESEVSGVNDRIQLAALEREFQQKQAESLMRQGVTLIDPKRIDIRGDISVEQDCLLDINVILEGDISIGKGVNIGANTVIKNSRIDDHVTILENCVIENAIVGASSKVGPFARIRPGTELLGNNHIGNFVELKNARVDEGSKVNHLSYVGDSEIGKTVNIGAGTITCNYDGANKHKTIIGDNAFIGSNTALVAPIKINQGSTIGAGSVITRETPEDKLTLTRAKQITIESWKRPVKQPR